MSSIATPATEAKEIRTMKTRKLHDRFGVEVFDVDLRQLSAGPQFDELRSLFEHHSLLLFRDQCMNEDVHNDFALLFGPLEDRDADTARSVPAARPPVPVLSNKVADRDALFEADSLRVLNLIGNQAWHTDSTFLHTPALINVITAYVVPSLGGETELVSTRAAWKDLPRSTQDRLRDTVFLHSVLPSRIRVDPALLELEEVSRYSSQAWNSVWPNPVTGDLALYIAGHVYGIRGWGDVEAREFVAELIDFCTRPEYVYQHVWRRGDVLVWDERATMHRGRPWPYDEERTLASCCVSARDVDGLESVRPVGGPPSIAEQFRYQPD